MATTEVITVQFILKHRPLSLKVRALMKEKGRPTPDLAIDCSSAGKNRTYTRVFNRSIYDKYKWICGCAETHKLYCFICLLFQKEPSVWIKEGVSDLKHIADQARKHENSVVHLSACIDYNVVGKVDIMEQLTNVYVQKKLKQDEIAGKNRQILRRLISCIKSCSAFEMAARGQEIEDGMDSPPVNLGLINFATELEADLAAHVKNLETLKNIQNDLLSAIFEVYREELIREINSASFLSIEVDDVTEEAGQKQLAVIVRYVYNERICERFWAFVKSDPNGIASNVIIELDKMLTAPTERSKVIAQSYDCLTVSDGKESVVNVVRKLYPNAYNVHSYSHQFNLIVEKAVGYHKNIKLFFANVWAFSSFFHKSPKRINLLNQIASKKLPQTPRWNFKTRIVNTLHEYKDLIRETLETLLEDDDKIDNLTLREACSLSNTLKNPDFLYWLQIFHFIMPHVEVLFNETQARAIDNIRLQKSLDTFEQQIFRIRTATDHIQTELEDEPRVKRERLSPVEDPRTNAAKEVCSSILGLIKDRFDFKDYLTAAKLFSSVHFKMYRQFFPQEYLQAAVSAYSMLDKARLENELTAIYKRDDMTCSDGVLSLLVFIADNGLKEVFSETYKLLDIICTIPMPTGEAGRCFATLEKVKAFLKCTASEVKLNALAVLTVEKKFVQSIPDFDNKVIDAYLKGLGGKEAELDLSA